MPLSGNQKGQYFFQVLSHRLLTSPNICHPEGIEGSYEILRAKALRMTVCGLFITMTPFGLFIIMTLCFQKDISEILAIIAAASALVKNESGLNIPEPLPDIIPFVYTVLLH